MTYSNRGDLFLNSAILALPLKEPAEETRGERETQDNNITSQFFKKKMSLECLSGLIG